MLLELTNVSKSYAVPPVTVLRDINLQLHDGDALGIVGPSGSGKSTLLNILGALDRPTQGQALFDGRDLAALTEPELAAIRNRQIGFIFQLHHLLPQCTVLENVLLPTLATPPVGAVFNRDRSRLESAPTTTDCRARAEQLLTRVGLSDRLTHRPGQLSGGECQRVAVVRALINQPKLLLADEPTGALDHANATGLGQLLIELNQEEGVALVVVTHSRELAGRFPRARELRDGVLE